MYKLVLIRESTNRRLIMNATSATISPTPNALPVKDNVFLNNFISLLLLVHIDYLV